MKKVLERNKGVILFYMIIAVLSILFSIRYRYLNEINNNSDTYIGYNN